MPPQPQLFLDPYGRVINALGQVVPVPPGYAPVPTAGAPTLLQRLQVDVGGVPLWGLLLGLAGAAGGGYYLYTRAKASVVDPEPKLLPNPGRAAAADDEESDDDDAPATNGARRSSSWSPSRSRVADRMQKWLTKANAQDGVTIIADADEAMNAGVKNPSPLLNLKVARKSELEKNGDFKKWARREGLDPVRLDATTIGLVPAQNTKRGAEWESYVDALREEGQRV